VINNFVPAGAVIDSWTLYSSYYKVPLIIVTYLFLIYEVLPKFMEYRKPFNLTTIIRLYNLFQILACMGFLGIFLKFGFSLLNIWKCFNHYDDEGVNMMDVDYYSSLFVMLRMSEFIETIFFVLRKRSDQVSVLHVYHHVGVVAVLWIFLKYNGGIMGVYIGIYNSMVHVIMYSYYLASSFKACCGMTKILKPYLTIIQITQLVVLIGQCVFAILPTCKNHRELYLIQIVNIAIILLLFIKFYNQSYKKKGEKRVKKS
jgi:hypothetical protein